MGCLQTGENAIWASKIGPPVKTKWRRWITDNIFVQIVSKSRRRGGLYILLENHRNIGAVNYGFELFHWLPWPWPAFPDSAIFSVLCAVFLSFFFQPLRFHHGRLPHQVFLFKNALQHTESTFSEQFQASLGLLACADVAAATQKWKELQVSCFDKSRKNTVSNSVASLRQG